MKNRLLTAVVMIDLLCLEAGVASAGETTRLTDLGEVRQALVSAGLGALDDRYHARPEGEGFLLVSPAQGLTASLGGVGVEVRGSSGAVGMRLLGWGCESALAPATDGREAAKANRVEFAREGITEWYVAGPLGVEQGFTVAAPAAGCGSAGELVIELALAGSAVLDGGGQSLVFPGAGLRYHGLVAVDAAGRELPARLELAGQHLAIRTEVAAARWPVTVDPIFEDAKLLASDGAVGDFFGSVVAVSGSTVVVGAVGDQDNGIGSGSAYVFTEPVGGWAGTLTEAAKLLASDGAAGDLFGIVAVSGSTVVVGAVGDQDNGIASGSAYVFTEPVGGWAGTLTEDAKLLASDRAAGDNFGDSVAVSGSTVVVGADEDGNGSDSRGSAYVFTEPVGGWAGTLNEAAKLLASDGAAGDLFGGDVAVSGSTVVVGSDETGSGSAYVFTEPVGGWAGTLNEDAKLLASDGAADDAFGEFVAISASTVVVGARLDDDNGSTSGSAYVFTEPVGGWSGTLNEDAKLLASDGAAGDLFGIVTVSGSTVVVGAGDLGDQDKGINSGSAYVFTKPVGGWAGTLTEDTKLLASDGAAGDFFGLVAVSGSTVVVGALGDNDNGSFSGSAYVFVLERIFADGFESGDSSAGWAPVEKTAQIGCWDTDGDPRDCAGTGEDGELQAGVAWPILRFTDNLDGTVTDNLTGLIWLKDANCPAGTTTWQEALDWVAGLNDIGKLITCADYAANTFTDWRLPNVKELRSLVDYGRPPLPLGHPFTNVVTSFYLSSSSVVTLPFAAWTVDMFAAANTIVGKGPANRVWPVRGGSQ